MGPAKGIAGRVARDGRLWEVLTFEKMITGPVIHLVYWAGLGVIVILAFSVVGASVGVAEDGGSATAAVQPACIRVTRMTAAIGLIEREPH